MNPNARIYPIYVLDEVIKGDKVEVGAAGSHNDVVLEIEFSANWEGLAKKIYWENANGTPGGFTLLLPSMLEPERDDVYLVPIPAQAKDAPGWMKMSIKGTKLVDGEEVLIRMSETGRFKLLKSNYNQWGGPDVGADQATQLQDEIEKLTADVPRQIEAHNTDPEAHADIREALERHTEDWDNPHHVTAAQVHSKMTLVFTGTITAGKPVRLTVDKPFSDVLEALQKGVVVDAMYESTVLRLSSFSDYAMNFVCAPYSVKNADKFLSINFTSSDMAYGVLLDLGNSEDNIQEVFTAHITDEVGRAVCDMTASEIIDADRIGVVKAEYTDPATEEIRTYYYFKQTKDRRAVFSKDGYIEDGVAKSSLIYVDSNGYVTVETRPLRLPVGFATCDDVADSPTSASNVWYIPKTVPRPSGIPGMMLDVKWINGHVGGLGYNVTLIWGEAGGADNETIVGQSSVSGGPQDVSIPVGGTVRYQLVDSGSRMSWKYVSGSLLKKQYSTATAPDTVKKVVPGLSGGYLPGMDIYLLVDKGSTASTMTLVPDDGKTLPVYGNGKGKVTGNIPTGYILHLKNAGDHWQILNQPGGSEGSEIVRYTCSDAANEAEKVQLAKTRATPPALKDIFIVSFTEGNTASTMNLHFGSAVYAVTGDLAMSPGYEAQFYVTKHDPAGLSNEVILLNPDSSIPIRELNESKVPLLPLAPGKKNARHNSALVKAVDDAVYRFPTGEYYLDGPIQMKSYTTYTGERTVLRFENSAGFNFTEDTYYGGIRFSNLEIVSRGSCIDFTDGSVSEAPTCKNVNNVVLSHLRLTSLESDCVHGPVNCKGTTGENCSFQLYADDIAGNSPKGSIFSNLGHNHNHMSNIFDFGGVKNFLRNTSGTLSNVNASFTGAEWLCKFDKSLVDAGERLELDHVTVEGFIGGIIDCSENTETVGFEYIRMHDICFAPASGFSPKKFAVGLPFGTQRLEISNSPLLTDSPVYASSALKTAIGFTSAALETFRLSCDSAVSVSFRGAVRNYSPSYFGAWPGSKPGWAVSNMAPSTDERHILLADIFAGCFVPTQQAITDDTLVVEGENIIVNSNDVKLNLAQRKSFKAMIPKVDGFNVAQVGASASLTTAMEITVHNVGAEVTLLRWGAFGASADTKCPTGTLTKFVLKDITWHKVWQI